MVECTNMALGNGTFVEAPGHRPAPSYHESNEVLFGWLTRISGALLLTLLFVDVFVSAGLISSLAINMTTLAFVVSAICYGVST